MEKATAKTKILPKAGKINFSITFSLEFYFEKATAKTKILPKVGNQFYNIFLTRISNRKSNRQNKDITKSCKTSFEENRLNSNNYSLLHQMMASICQIEEVAKMQVASNFEIDDMEAAVRELDSDPALQRQASLPTDDELDNTLLYRGNLPEPSDQMSPESIAGWMVKRLSRRIYSAVLSGSKALKRYYVMREIMRGTVLVCQRSELDRRRAMAMLHDIQDLSDHSSSNDSEPDPMEDFTSNLPGDETMDLSESIQGDIYDWRERVYGPVEDGVDTP